MKLHPPKAFKRRPCLGVLQRLFAKIEEDENGCWVWLGYKDAQGYGQIKVDGRAVWVHRLTYVLFKRRLRDGDEVDHICANHSCCNPDHLKRCTAAENRAQGGRRSKTRKVVAPRDGAEYEEVPI